MFCNKKTLRDEFIITWPEGYQGCIEGDNLKQHNLIEVSWWKIIDDKSFILISVEPAEWKAFDGEKFEWLNLSVDCPNDALYSFYIKNVSASLFLGMKSYKGGSLVLLTCDNHIPGTTVHKIYDRAPGLFGREQLPADLVKLAERK